MTKNNNSNNQDSSSNESSKKKTFYFTDFYGYPPQNKVIYVPTRELWPRASVDTKYKLKNADKGETPSSWLFKNRSVEQMTWSPGFPAIINDKFVSSGGWKEKKGIKVFNLYEPPTIIRGDGSEASPWLNHIKKIYPLHVDHIVAWFAHHVQYPEEKLNHALVLGGAQGIGKDTLLEPISRAVGPWNFKDITPMHLLGRFNGFVKSVILRVSEARDLGPSDRYKLYEHMKIYTAAPPEVLRVDEKYINEYDVFNVCGVVITTNYKAGGIYLPADDRRHYVAWSELNKDDFHKKYFESIWNWYESGGFEHVADYLHDYDLSNFDPKAPPPKTNAFWDIVDADRPIEDARMADALDRLGRPQVVTINEVSEASKQDFKEWLEDNGNRRYIPNRFEDAGYVKHRNPNANDGLWKINGSRKALYIKRELSEKDRSSAVNDYRSKM